MNTIRIKRPDDRLDYDVDFSRWLTDGDTITAVSQAEVTQGTVEVDAHDFTATAVKVWLSGGVVGETATILVQVTTTQGREKEVCFKLRVRECC